MRSLEVASVACALVIHVLERSLVDVCDPKLVQVSKVWDLCHRESIPIFIFLNHQLLIAVRVDIQVFKRKTWTRIRHLARSWPMILGFQSYLHQVRSRVMISWAF